MHSSLLYPLAALVAFPTSAANPPVRVGLDTQALEWIVQLEGGGGVCTREGRKVLEVRPGEKLRIWWDSRGEGDPATEYRVQVGPPLPLPEAEALMAKLRAMGQAPERFRVSDGDTWRVLTGHFPRAEAADPLVASLAAAGIAETWVGTEKLAAKPRRGRALYAISETYERIPLPTAGVWLKPAGDLVTLQGKGRYRGRVEIFPNAEGRLTVVNTLPMETYLQGVVPREMGPSEFPNLEALKAQAVAARTYAAANLGKRAKEGFDLLDTVADQVYGGRDGETAMSDQAVKETEGLVATFKGKPIQALFMANGGGATVDNRHVFAGDQGYLQGVSSYAVRPLTLPFQGRPIPAGDQGWLTWEILKLAAVGALDAADLSTEAMARPLNLRDLQGPLALLCERLRLPRPAPADASQASALLALAKSLQFNRVIEGQERPQDAAYFQVGPSLPAGDRLLAAFLTRRGLIPPAAWSSTTLTRAHGLHLLGRLWAELEPMDLAEGVLQRDGQVRFKAKDPLALPVMPEPLLVEEAPGGALRLVPSADIQVGDKVRWLPQPGGSRILVRRLDPDGASWDRYNPTAHWRVEVKEADLVTRLKERAGLASLGSMEAIHNDQGRVLELKVTDRTGANRTFTGMRIRLLLGLKDNVFRWIQVGQAPERRWIFFGRGWGHGVGMDQTGAYGMALEGHTFDAILKHYYRGIDLTPMR